MKWLPRVRRHRQWGVDAGPAPSRIALFALALLALATAMMLNRVEPFGTAYYIFAWYPTLLLLDCAVAATSGRYYLLSRPGYAISLLLWSAITWFFFELVNFRLQNWYYVFLQPDRTFRWLGTTVSFMTVLPAIFLAERWLDVRGAGSRIRCPTFRIGPRLPTGVFVTGLAFVALTLAWPRAFYPLVWGALTLLLEPWNYRRDPARSLLGDLSAGRPGRLLRLLLGGLAIGFIWELYNIQALGKWIYTVPGFESIKLFEMPVPGFLGFPIFALDCFVVYQALVLVGVAIPEEQGSIAGPAALRVERTLAAGVAAIAFAVASLIGMERWNIDSYMPRLEGLWLTEPASRAALAGTPYTDLFLLAEAPPEELATATGASSSEVALWVSAARLATLRGIGTENASLLWQAGIRSVSDLAAADPESLGSELRSLSSRPRVATPPKVRVWVRAARRAMPQPLHTPGQAAGGS